MRKVIIPPELEERICLSWSSGVSYAVIAKMCGVNHKRIRKLIKDTGTRLKPKICENILCGKTFHPKNVGIHPGGVQSFCSTKCKDDHKTQLGRKYNRELRMKLLSLLGGRCVVCGTEDYRVLQLNHVHGGGVKDFRENGPKKIYQDVFDGKRSGEFDLRCANCNRRYEYEQGRAWSNEKLAEISSRS